MASNVLPATLTSIANWLMEKPITNGQSLSPRQAMEAQFVLQAKRIALGLVVEKVFTDRDPSIGLYYSLRGGFPIGNAMMSLHVDIDRVEDFTDIISLGFASSQRISLLDTKRKFDTHSGVVVHDSQRVNSDLVTWAAITDLVALNKRLWDGERGQKIRDKAKQHGLLLD